MKHVEDPLVDYLSWRWDSILLKLKSPFQVLASLPRALGHLQIPRETRGEKACSLMIIGEVIE